MIRRALDWSAEQRGERSQPGGRGHRRTVLFLIVLGLVLAVIGGASGLLTHGRGQVVIVLAWVLAAFLSAHRSSGGRALLRALLEYAAVGIFAAALALTLAGPPAAAKPHPTAKPRQSTHSQTAQTAQVAGVACTQLEPVHLTGVCKRLSRLQRRASSEAGRRPTPPSTTVKPHHR